MLPLYSRLYDLCMETPESAALFGILLPWRGLEIMNSIIRRMRDGRLLRKTGPASLHRLSRGNSSLLTLRECASCPRAFPPVAHPTELLMRIWGNPTEYHAGFEPAPSLWKSEVLPLHQWYMEPAARFERATHRLQGDCTAVVLRWREQGARTRTSHLPRRGKNPQLAENLPATGCCAGKGQTRAAWSVAVGFCR